MTKLRFALALALCGCLGVIAFTSVWEVETVDDSLVRVNRLTGTVQRFEPTSGEWVAHGPREAEHVLRGPAPRLEHLVAKVTAVHADGSLQVVLVEGRDMQGGEELIVSRGNGYVCVIRVAEEESGRSVRGIVVPGMKKLDPQIGDAVSVR